MSFFSGCSKLPRPHLSSLVLLSLLVAVSLGNPAPVMANSPGPSRQDRSVLEAFGNASDGAILEWIVRTPRGRGPWPGVLIVHAGGFTGGGPNDPEVVRAAEDLTNEGYVTYAITYRLAPPGSIKRQRSLGQFPDQTDDVKLAVQAARNDSRCNGRVGAVGGSAGAAHVAFVAVTGTPGIDKVDVGACLSGAYDFTDFDPARPDFQIGVTNYVGSDDASPGGPLQQASPAWQPNLRQASPLLLVSTAGDTMPPEQLTDMAEVLSMFRADFDQIQLRGGLHAFAYWSNVRADVIAMLGSVLKR